MEHRYLCKARGEKVDRGEFCTSVCGGCHGNDGKGLGGTYAELTRKTMLGIEKREASLRMQMMKSDSKNSEAPKN